MTVFTNKIFDSHGHRQNVEFTRKKNFLNEIRSLNITINHTVFNRRTEVLLWHPFYRSTLYAASHGGDIVMFTKLGDKLRNLQSDSYLIRKGIGKGGSICDMMFDNTCAASKLFLCSHDSTLSIYDIEKKNDHILLDTGDVDHWFTSLCHSLQYNCILSSDNRGYVHTVDPRVPGVTATSRSGRNSSGAAVDMSSWPGSRARLHKANKISWLTLHTDGHVICTASNDKTARLFDIRRLQPDLCINILRHSGVVSCARFSPHKHSTLLTTSQNDQLRIYDVNDVNDDNPRVNISHGHRHYQHLTGIKADWHPLQEDLVSIGCYGQDSRRGIDWFDVSGVGSNRERRKELKGNNDETDDLQPCFHQDAQSQISTICCVNKFNMDASFMATATANSVVVWAPTSQEENEMTQEDGQRKRRNVSENNENQRRQRRDTSSDLLRGSRGSNGRNGDDSKELKGKKGGKTIKEKDSCGAVDRTRQSRSSRAVSSSVLRSDTIHDTTNHENNVSEMSRDTHRITAVMEAQRELLSQAQTRRSSQIIRNSSNSRETDSQTPSHQQAVSSSTNVSTTSSMADCDADETTASPSVVSSTGRSSRRVRERVQRNGHERRSSRNSTITPDSSENNTSFDSFSYREE
mmetsp:Transcript_5566/g.5751  ORF Transcript_5566/g.5751 Transcript_5566/m.5751 type:complete len:633 (-) Transcript_5566:96-1994(-)